MTSLSNKKPISKAKNSTNYSNAELSRRAKVKAEKLVRDRDFKIKSKAASKKINDTWIGNKKTVSPKAKRSSAQLRAIYAKKK